MSLLQKTVGSVSRMTQTVASLLKIAIQSRGASGRGEPKSGSLIILGNGPSLRDTLTNDREKLEAHTLMAVNFFANSEAFIQLRPEYYVLADGHFFRGVTTDPNVRKLWDNIVSASWDMTIFIPSRYKAMLFGLAKLPSNIKVKYFNLTPVEGYKLVTHFTFDKGLGMPRPRNVLIPSIMLGIREGFKTIYLVGADHSWSKTLWVDDSNRVISVQPHFYKDNDKERSRVENEYAGYHLHDILNSLTVAFRSYFDIAAYAAARGVKILNATPGSFIDAFPRTHL